MTACPVSLDVWNHGNAVDAIEARAQRQEAAKHARRKELHIVVYEIQDGWAWEVDDADGGMMDDGWRPSKSEAESAANSAADHIAELHGNTIR